MKCLFVATVILLAMLDMGMSKLMDYHMGYGDIQSYENHPCDRKCDGRKKPKVCEYDFLIEHYHTLTKACYNCPFTQSDCSRPHCVAADGVERGIITVNRMMPGPGIHVCEHDTVRVRIHNKLEMGEGVTIHWHGVYQKGTPHMDGVPMVTQCAIPTHTSFTYTFKADNAGTHYWHAHSGLQRGEGVFGALVVRQPRVREIHYRKYDVDTSDYTMIVNDWSGEDIAPTFAGLHQNDEGMDPTSMLINGKGDKKEFKDLATGRTARTPREVFTVKRGSVYRFRVISNGIQICPITVSVDQHMMQIIATDGNAVEPMEVESFTIYTGERYDFTLAATGNKPNYLIRVNGICGPTQTAILNYEGSPIDYDLNTPAPKLNGIELNPFNTKQSATKIQVTELKSILGSDVTTTRKVDKQFIVAMDFNRINNPRYHNNKYYSLNQIKTPNRKIYSPQFNHITMMMPPSPALTQFEDIPKGMLCNESAGHGDCIKGFCECVHILKVDLDDVVEVIVVDEGDTWDAHHPVHLHGHGFRVVAMDKIGRSTTISEVLALDAAGEIKRNLDSAPEKDTVNVNDGGYTIIRFHANNPGMWLFHCHIEFHSEMGMALVFQVGETSQFPSTPPKFPTCGSWDGGLVNNKNGR